MFLQSNKNKLSKWLLALKLMLVFIAVWFIYSKVFNNENSTNYLFQLKTAFMQPGLTMQFVAVFILMILNWGTEAVKWKYMIGKIESISLTRSMEAVLSGLTVSIFTPNRIGEYAGRVFHLNPGKRLQATFITVIENCSQLLITILFGSMACMVYISEFMEMNTWVLVLFRSMLILLCIFCLLLYFNLDLFEKIFMRFRLSEYWKKVFHVFSLYSFNDLFKVLLLSIIRYIIFSLQFYILLKIYGAAFPVFQALIMIAMTFFVMAVVPTFAITELGIRGAVSAFFFGKITIDVLPVLNAAFSLWLINLAIPALAGAILFFHFRLEKANN